MTLPKGIYADADCADIVAVIKARTHLVEKKNGWVGNCPFCKASDCFSVEQQKKLYYCHGCGAQGDTVSFVQATEHLDAEAAIRYIAKWYGPETGVQGGGLAHFDVVIGVHKDGSLVLIKNTFGRPGQMNPTAAITSLAESMIIIARHAIADGASTPNLRLAPPAQDAS